MATWGGTRRLTLRFVALEVTVPFLAEDLKLKAKSHDAVVVFGEMVAVERMTQVWRRSKNRVKGQRSARTSQSTNRIVMSRFFFRLAFEILWHNNDGTNLFNGSLRRHWLLSHDIRPENKTQKSVTDCLKLKWREGECSGFTKPIGRSKPQVQMLAILWFWVHLQKSMSRAMAGAGIATFNIGCQWTGVMFFAINSLCFQAMKTWSVKGCGAIAHLVTAKICLVMQNSLINSFNAAWYSLLKCYRVWCCDWFSCGGHHGNWQVWMITRWWLRDLIGMLFLIGCCW